MGLCISNSLDKLLQILLARFRNNSEQGFLTCFDLLIKRFIILEIKNLRKFLELASILGDECFHLIEIGLLKLNGCIVDAVLTVFLDSADLMRVLEAHLKQFRVFAAERVKEGIKIL